LVKAAGEGLKKEVHTGGWCLGDEGTAGGDFALWGSFVFRPSQKAEGGKRGMAVGGGTQRECLRQCKVRLVIVEGPGQNGGDGRFEGWVAREK